jgi:hypothetical protein
MGREPDGGNIFKRIGILRKNMVSALTKIQQTSGGRQERTAAHGDAGRY